MIPGNKNKNGSSFVTARHGGDGKGNVSAAGEPKTINHTGGVNPRKGPADSDSDDKGDGKQDVAAQKADGSKNGDAGATGLPDYVSKMADKLRTNHGLTHNHAVRIAAAITKKHAGGHASVDESTRQAAEAAHGQMTGLLKSAKK